MSLRELNIFVISGPSGAGKSSISRKLLNQVPRLKKMITCTTREKKANEINDVNYHFLSKDDFASHITNNEFIEYSKVYNEFYGSLQEDFDKLTKISSNILFVIDVKGAIQIKEKFPFAKLIFISPPSNEVLHERLSKNENIDEDEISSRLNLVKLEMSYVNSFDYVVQNDDFEKTLTKVKSLILASIDKSN
ncbi:MAG: guanylate kinase [Candidatus ainarchaeum sp.]|nr:guanylate kinase [Candidatus ainarchaeum sp.]